MKGYTLDEAEDLLIGKKGTEERDEYEFELKLEISDKQNDSVHKLKVSKF